MKKLMYKFAGLFMVTSLMVACVQPDSGDGVPDGNLTINYAVQVVPVGDVAKGLNGASVTIQVNGETKTSTVGADGIAVFEDIKPGTVSGYVSATGFASMNFSATISKTNVDANTTDFVTSTVYLIGMNSTIDGRIYGDWDLDGNTTLTDAGNFQAVDLYVSYNLAAYPMGAGNGALNSVSMDVTTYGITTAADGRFSLANIPNTFNGYVTATYWVADEVMTDPVSGATVVMNVPSTGVTLNPGVTKNIGDIFAF